MSYELSYAKPDDPTLRRWLMRAVEDLSGRRRLLPLYQRWRHEIVERSPRMWSEALELIGTRLEIDARGGWHAAVPAGPVVVIANTPSALPTASPPSPWRSALTGPTASCSLSS
jgi:putative hemolysin